MQCTGIKVCVGIAASKTLAKLSNHVAKKRPKSKGVFDYNQLDARQQASVLGNLQVNEVWGIGRRLSKSLNEQDIATVLQLRDADVASMRAR